MWAHRSQRSGAINLRSHRAKLPTRLRGILSRVRYDDYRPVKSESVMGDAVRGVAPARLSYDSNVQGHLMRLLFCHLCGRDVVKSSIDKSGVIESFTRTWRMLPVSSDTTRHVVIVIHCNGPISPDRWETGNAGN